MPVRSTTSPNEPASYPKVAFSILIATVVLGVILLVFSHLGEWSFLAFLALGIVCAVIAFIGGDFLKLKAGPSGFELERYAKEAKTARDEAVGLAKIVARLAAFDLFGDPGFSRHGPREKLRIAWLEQTLTDLKRVGGDDSDAETLLALCRDLEAYPVEEPEGTEGKAPEHCKERDEYLILEQDRLNAIAKRYIDFLEERTGKTALADAARKNLKPRPPQYRPES